MAVERIIGVDFGTSTSVIRVKRYENGNPIGEKLETKEVVFGGNGAMVPTLIMKKDDDASVSYFGYEAQQKKKKFTNFHSFKMNLESTDSALQAQAKLLTEEFFCYMAKQYKSQSEGGHLGNSDDKERTIISYPVKWSEETKSFMLEIAKKAGFPNVTGMDEAQAAIQAVIVMSTDHLQKHGLLKNGEGANILLIDMGAGTTDLVLARYVPGDEPKTEVLNTWPKSGDIQFGGREIDNLLQNFFREMLDEDDAEVIFRRIGSDKFKSWKEETVSPALQKHDSVSDFEVLDSCVEMMGVDLDEYCLDRTAFEKCLADYLKQFPELVDGCLRDAGMNGSDVDLVIVTGGHSQWYFVNDMLAGKMPQFGNLDLPKIRENPARIVPISRPQETVALGLAYNGIHFDLSASAADDEPDRKKVMADLGSTLNAEKKQKQEQSHESIAEYFRMKFDPANKAFNLSGQGTVVIGTVLQGCVKVGDRVYVCGRPGQSRIAQVQKIALHQESKNVTTARTGDCIAVLLSGISEADANRATYIASEPVDYVQQSADDNTVPLQQLVQQFFRDYKGTAGRNYLEKLAPKLRVNLNVPDGEQVLAAWDSTMFGSCKNGTVITPEGIYCKAILMETEFHTWREIVGNSFSFKSDVSKVVIEAADGTEMCIGFFLTSDMNEAFELYNELQVFLNGDVEENISEINNEAPFVDQPHTSSRSADSVSTPLDAGSKWDGFTTAANTAEQQAGQQAVEQRRKQELEEARRRAVAMQVDPKDIPYTPESEFEIGSVGGKDCSIKKYLGNRSVVKIPPAIRGRKVVSIGAMAFGAVTIFQANRTIEKVIIPESVRKIEYRAFNLCSNLKEVIAHKNIENIGAEAFYGCNSLNKMDFGMGDCAEGHVIFPPNLKSIGAVAFLKNDLLSTYIFKEILMSKRTKVKDIIGVAKNFNPKYCAVFYYD